MTLPILRLLLAVALLVDGLIALPGTQGIPGIAPRFYVAHLILLAVFFITEKELWHFALLALGGLIALTLRDSFIVGRSVFFPSDLTLPLALISTFLWAGSLWFAGQYAAQKHRGVRINARIRDGLTGLYSQDYFHKTLEQRLSATRRRALMPALLWLDIDNFKNIHDRISHDRGDEFLRGFGDFLLDSSELFRETDLICRAGGDEFAIILSGVDQPEMLENLKERVLVSIDRFLTKQFPDLRAREIDVGVSVGGVIAKPGMTARELLTVADKLMYEMKEQHHAAQARFRGRGLGADEDGGR